MGYSAKAKSTPAICNSINFIETPHVFEAVTKFETPVCNFPVQSLHHTSKYPSKHKLRQNTDIFQSSAIFCRSDRVKQNGSLSRFMAIRQRDDTPSILS